MANLRMQEPCVTFLKLKGPIVESFITDKLQNGPAKRRQKK